MAMIDRNGHAPDTRIASIERRLKNIAESGEHRITILRDAMADFTAAELAERDKKLSDLTNQNVELQQQIADLNRKFDQITAVDKQVAEITQRLDARQVAREEGRRGPTGRQGERGARGEQGPPGPRGPAGRPADPALTIYSWLLDREKFQVTPFLNDGTASPTLDLRPLFESYFHQTNS